MNVDTSKIRGRIIEKFTTYGAFAAAIGKELRFVSAYLNHQRTLSQADIFDWANALDISNEQIPLYFFTAEVHETEQAHV